MANRKKVNLYLDLPDLNALKAISTKTGIPMAVLIRKACKKVIAEYRKS
jgi:predicted DNA binding CopG/RHH family protein